MEWLLVLTFLVQLYVRINIYNNFSFYFKSFFKNDDLRLKKTKRNKKRITPIVSQVKFVTVLFSQTNLSYLILKQKVKNICMS